MDETKDLDEIKSTILEIISDKETMNKSDIEKKWNWFGARYPMIFVNIIDKDLDLNMLEIMFSKLKLGQRNKSEMNKQERSFGELLANKYIYNNGTFPKPSHEEINKLYKNSIDTKKKLDEVDIEKNKLSADNVSYRKK